ncbi:MAG: hypothetical protein H6Q90_6014 [Deltaproteobacteria bacterium]|nr:hypothetical protein [Deltaproteobacteria bacterium]
MRAYRVGAASALAVVWLAGCAGDDLRLDGVHYQYVVSELRVPTNAVTARENSLDLDGNDSTDNQLGQVFGALNQNGLGVGDTAREALLRGGLVMLADLETTDFENTKISGFTTYLGSDPDPAPCLDPARLESCGQHVLGQGHFSVDDSSASDHAVAPIVDGVFIDTVGVLPVEIAIDPSMPIRLDLRGARVRLSQLSEGHVSGILGGGITQADIDGVVIPQATAQMNRIVQAECAQPSGQPPCGCLGRADLLQYVFDDDDDCQIEVGEISTNSLVRSLLDPDIVVDGQPLLSFGVGVELATATFTAP